MESRPPHNKRAPGRPKIGDESRPMREKILKTASQLFMEHGYEPVSLNMIADRAGVTKASLYYYFNGKADLFTTAIVEMMGRINVNTARLLEQPLSLRQRLEQIAEVKLRQSHIEFESMMREALSSLSEDQREAIRAAEHTIHEALAGHFRQAMEQGEVGAGNPLLLAHAFSALLMLGNRELRGAEPQTGAKLSAVIVELFWHGVAVRTASPD